MAAVVNGVREKEAHGGLRYDFPIDSVPRLDINDPKAQKLILAEVSDTATRKMMYNH